MRVAVLGSGGREHALADKISENVDKENLFLIPGNPGTEEIGSNINIPLTDFGKVLSFCQNNKIDFVVIGPEQPLVDGLADLLRDNNFAVFGPGKNSARIEGDKIFAKELMKKHGVPTADSRSFSKGEIDQTLEYVKHSNYPLVIKANGLAAGKGVAICNGFSEAESIIDSYFLKNIFGEAGNKILVEEFLTGEEVSVFAITDGKEFITLPASQDHKRAFDNDLGKNTGGMGAYAPAPMFSEEFAEFVDKNIISPTLKALEQDGSAYIGCLYCGLILTDKGPKVIEFNCRFGDPETQVVLPLLKGDFLELLYSAAAGNLNKNAVTYSGGTSVCVILSSGGYPDSYKKGYEIKGLKNLVDPHIKVFHAGTKKEEGKIFTNGGRVLGITAVSEDNSLSDCKTMVYANLVNVQFKDMHYRKDIGDKGIKYDKLFGE